MIDNVEEVLNNTGVAITGFNGTSMLPMLREGKDRIVITKPIGRLKLHDVPLYKSNDKYVLHRIIKVKTDGYVIRGDNLYKNEYNITDDNIIGVLKAFYRNGKLFYCNNSKIYKAYVCYVRLSYPMRYILFRLIRPQLGKIKRNLIKK